MSKQYIWTNHALKRLTERKISRTLIDQTLMHPEQTIQKKDSAFELRKQTNGRTVAAIVKLNDKGEMIIISCWINPPFPGTKDYKKRQRYIAMQKASFLKKLWFTLLNLLGL